MKKSLVLSCAVLLSGCAGVSPELYALVMEYFTLPDSCYSNNAQPSAVTVTDAPGLMQVQVWDGPDNTAILEIEQGGRTIDMGDAPSIQVGGLMKGTRGTGGWTFVSEQESRATLVGNTVTDKSKFELVFERAQTFKATGTLSSSRTCTGSTCGGATPSCTVSGINGSGTRIAVQYERGP